MGCNDYEYLKCRNRDCLDCMEAALSESEEPIPPGSSDGSIPDLPYMVYHPEGSDHGLRPPRFKTLKEAREAQKRFNAEVPGHIVREDRG